MTRSGPIGASALALAGLLAPPVALADVPRPDCAVRGKVAADGLPLAACDALARHLARDYPGLDPAALRLVLSHATTRGLTGRIERVDGSVRGPNVSVDALDGPLGGADLDHFAQNALILFLFR